MSVNIESTAAIRTHNVTLTYVGISDQELAELTDAMGSTASNVFYDDFDRLDDQCDALGIRRW